MVVPGLAGCAGRPHPVPMPPAALPGAAPGAVAAEVHVIGRGWHTDIGLPVAGLNGVLAEMARDFPGARHLVFGFGDRSYLLDRNPSPIRMLGALLPGPGAILLTALSASPEAAFSAGNVIVLPVSRPELDRLQRFVVDSLDRGGTAAGARLRPIAEGPYPGSVFHASPVTYAASYTCNTWTAEALAVAGLPVRAGGVLFAGQVLLRARRAGEERRGVATVRAAKPYPGPLVVAD